MRKRRWKVIMKGLSARPSVSFIQIFITKEIADKLNDNGVAIKLAMFAKYLTETEMELLIKSSAREVVMRVVSRSKPHCSTTFLSINEPHDQRD